MDKKDNVLFTVADALTPKVDNGEVAFSLLGRDHKNPPVVVEGADLYNGTLTGETAATLNASSCDSPTHSGPSVMVLNDQGGSVMGVSENVSGTLRSEEHGHQPIVFEPGAASRVGGHVYEDDVADTVRANAGDNQQAVVYGISSYESNSMKSSNPNSGIYEADTSRTLDNNGGNPACNQGGMAVVQPHTYQKTTGALMASGYGKLGTQEAMNDMFVIEGNGSRPSHQGDGYSESEIMYTLNSTERHAVATEPPLIEMTITKNTVIQDGICPTLTGRMGTGGNQVNSVLQQTDNPKAVDCRNLYENDVSATLQAKENGGHSLNYQNPVRTSTVVRRLTPLECERLQGFPDGWTDIGEWEDSKGKKRKCTDGARYKALGNSIALPFWQWMAERIVTQYDRSPTMASLFDGIGGFPLVFLRCGCEPIWASEIEDFCVAVTRLRFKENIE